MTDAVASQALVEALGQPTDAQVRAGQLLVEAVGLCPPPSHAVAAQLLVEMLAKPPASHARVGQLLVEMICWPIIPAVPYAMTMVLR